MLIKKIEEKNKYINKNFLKEKFLFTLKGKKLKYKRYFKSPLRYPGGKSLAVGYIIELIPNNIKEILSPFFGGGSVEIACAKELDIKIIGFDIFDILVNFWKQLFTNKKNFIQEIKKLKINKNEYLKIKNKLKKHWKNEKKLIIK